MRLSPSRTASWLLPVICLAGTCAASALAAGEGSAATASLDRRRSLDTAPQAVAAPPSLLERRQMDPNAPVDIKVRSLDSPPPLTRAKPLAQVPGSADDSTLTTPWNSFSLSFIMILVSEIGDKTFLIAALMAMKHSRILVFSAALSSLAIMTVLSALLGHAVPQLLPKKFTSFAAGILFLVFGVKMLKEGLAMDPNSGVDEELEEVEQEIAEESLGSKEAALEAGLAPPVSRSRSTSPSGRGPSGVEQLVSGTKNLASLVFSPAWVQTFVMTFLGEWGDRSQIATIAMAAGQGYLWVCVGAIAGHSICTGGAVIGGRMIATKISVRNSKSIIIYMMEQGANENSHFGRRRRIFGLWRHLPRRKFIRQLCLRIDIHTYPPSQGWEWHIRYAWRRNDVIKSRVYNL